MSNHRGEYRPLHRVLLDDQDYQSLTPSARLMFVTLKLALGALGIGVLFGEQLEVETGLARDEVERALTELTAIGWLKRDGRLLWLKNGFRFEPSFAPTNTTHRAHVHRVIAGLPRSPLVAEFRATYSEWFNDGAALKETREVTSPNPPSEGPSEGLSEGLSEGPTQGPTQGPHGVVWSGGVESSSSHRSPKRRPQRRAAATAPTHDTWLTPAAVAWEKRNGPGSFPFGEAAHALAPLKRAGITSEEIGVRLANYLDAMRATGSERFAKLTDFAQRHAQYAGPLARHGELTPLGEQVTRVGPAKVCA